MAKASINFKPVKSNSEAHNERTTELDYNFPDLKKDNESFVQERISDRLRAIKAHCKDVSKRKLQKNAEPIREAVVNLNAHHTMDDLAKLADKLKERFGIECFQIHIHRDEGKSREELNYHAHMVFDWQDKSTGKMRKLSPLDLSQCQTVVAQVLGMERGELKVNSNRERLEAVEYKRMKEEERLKEAEMKANEARQSLEQHSVAVDRLKKDFSALEGLKTDISTNAKSLIIKKSKFGILTALDEPRTKRNIEALLHENKTLRDEKTALKSENTALKAKVSRLDKQLAIFRGWTETLGKWMLQGKRLGPKNKSLLAEMFPSIRQILEPKTPTPEKTITPEPEIKPKKGKGRGFGGF